MFEPNNEDNKNFKDNSESHKDIQAVFNEYKSRLIDLSTKNSALLFKGVTNIKSGYDFASISNIADQLPEFLISRTQETIIIKVDDFLEPLTEDEEEDSGEDDDEQIALSKAKDKFDKFKKQIINSLKEIENIKRESGKILSYMGYPFLEGQFEDNKTDFRSPLFLFPVTLSVDRNSITIENNVDADILLNRVLILAFSKYSDITIPFDEYAYESLESLGIENPQGVKDFILNNDFFVFDTDEDIMKPVEMKKYTKKDSDFVAGVTEIKPYMIWSRFDVANNLFRDYSTLLDEEVTNGAISNSTSIQTLLGNTRGVTRPEPLNQSDPSPFKEKELGLITNLDNSQELAVWYSMKSDDLVVFGPPGTGKSQVLTSIISNNVFNDKNILMVSQKKAALDVVYNRLGKLNDKAILITDAGAERRKFYDKVKLAIKDVLSHRIAEETSLFGGIHSNADSSLDLSEDIDENLELLDRLHEVLTVKNPQANISVSEMYQLSMKLPTELQLPFLRNEKLKETILNLQYRELLDKIESLSIDSLLSAYKTYCTLKDKDYLVDLNTLQNSDVMSLQDYISFLIISLTNLDDTLSTFNQKYSLNSGVYYSNLLRVQDAGFKMSIRKRIEDDLNNQTDIIRNSFEGEKGSYLDKLLAKKGYYFDKTLTKSPIYQIIVNVSDDMVFDKYEIEEASKRYIEQVTTEKSALLDKSIQMREALKLPLEESDLLKQLEQRYEKRYEPFTPSELALLEVPDNRTKPEDTKLEELMDIHYQELETKIDEISSHIIEVKNSLGTKPNETFILTQGLEVIDASRNKDFQLVKTLYEANIVEPESYYEALKQPLKGILDEHSRKIKELNNLYRRVQASTLDYVDSKIAEALSNRGIQVLENPSKDPKTMLLYNELYRQEKLVMNLKDYVETNLSADYKELEQLEEELQKFRLFGKNKVKEDFDRTKANIEEKEYKLKVAYATVITKVNEYETFTNVYEQTKAVILSDIKKELDEEVAKYKKLTENIESRVYTLLDFIGVYDNYLTNYETKKIPYLKELKIKQATLTKELNQSRNIYLTNLKQRVAINIRLNELFDKLKINAHDQLDEDIETLNTEIENLKVKAKRELEDFFNAYNDNERYKKEFEKEKSHYLEELFNKRNLLARDFIKDIDNLVQQYTITKKRIWGINSFLLERLGDCQIVKTLQELENTQGSKGLTNLITYTKTLESDIELYTKSFIDFKTIGRLGEDSKIILDYIFSLQEMNLPIDQVTKSQLEETIKANLQLQKGKDYEPTEEELTFNINFTDHAFFLLKQQYLNYYINKMNEVNIDVLNTTKEFKDITENIVEDKDTKIDKVIEEIITKVNVRGKQILLSPDHEVKFKAMQQQANKGIRTLPPVRKFVIEFWEELRVLFPIFLLTPDIVSQILPLEKDLFDKVLFDEASQMFVENAIPSLYRGKSIVIAGDDKQLKPSETFSGRFDSQGDEASDDLGYTGKAAMEQKSLLDLAKVNYATVSLLYHYRSKFAELINFSNYAFYNGTLKLAPNVQKATNQDRPIERIKVQGNWVNSTNKLEAIEVAKLVKQILETRSNNETIGVITFSSQQATEVQNALQKLQLEDNTFSANYSKETNRIEDNEDLSLFVKNIENVQGDERDIIIFSTGYCKNEDGRFPFNFGSLSQDGGENRLNVAVSRAKKKIYVVTSFEPEEMKADNEYKNEGPKLLKAYMQYVRALDNNNIEEVEAILQRLCPLERTNNLKLQFDSPFEEQVYNQLVQHGFEVETQVGVSGYRIDLAVYDRESHRYLAGIECDGAMYHSSKSARERDIYRQKFLESRGWTILRIWSRDWWYDNNKELQRIIEELEELKEQN